MARLSNTASGTTGELKAQAELARAGLQVASPLWNDDEKDLVILYDIHGRDVVVPVQVKSVQFGNSAGRRFVQGLMKRYVDGAPGLCLALYCPDSDRLWFLHGSATIRDVYERQATWNPKHRPYDSLAPTDDVRVALAPEDAEFDAQWLVSTDGLPTLVRRIEEVAAMLAGAAPPEIVTNASDVTSDTTTTLRFTIETCADEDGSAPLTHAISGPVLRVLQTAFSVFESTAEEVLGSSALPLGDYLRLLRELLVNAVAHRSYRDPGDIVCTVSPTQVAISSPGGLPDVVSVDMIKAGGAVVCRNPRLAHQLAQVGAMERMGVGLRTVARVLDSYGLQAAEYTLCGSRFQAVIKIAGSRCAE